MRAEVNRARVLGVPVDCIDMDSAVRQCSELARNGLGGHVVTINPEMALECGHDRELSDVISAAQLVVPDGIGVVMALKMLGWPHRGRVPGIELAEALMKDAAHHGGSVYLVGAKPGVAVEAARKMTERVSGLEVSGVQHGYFCDDEEERVLQAIGEAGPMYVFVGLGAGKQEKWISRARSAAPRAVWVGIGGSFDVMSGNLRRAPSAWQKLGLEWLYRLIQEPSRARRMISLPRFMSAVAADVIRGKGNRHMRS